MINIIRKINPNFLSMVGLQRYNLTSEFVDNKYTIYHEYKDKLLIENVLTCELICCDSKDELTEKFMIEHWLKLPKDIDQFTYVKAFKDLNNNAYIWTPKPKIKKVVIFTTTDCNARCYYCFENGIKKIPMDTKVADDIADFLIEHGNMYYISWFGGEPLYNSEVIDIITDKLRKNNIYFVSDIVTNGYLLDKFSINKLKYRWNLGSAQVTLDGFENTYNDVKNYIYKDDKSPFYKIIDNIFYLSNNGIKTTIRFNVSPSNIDDLYKVVDVITSSEKFNSSLGMYASKLLREPDSTDEIEKVMCEAEVALNRYILSKIGLISDKKFFAYPDNNYCLADSGNSYVINPYGEIGRCEHYTFEHQVYSIYNPIVNVNGLDYFTKHRYLEDTCKNCQIFPNCVFTEICSGIDPCDTNLGNTYYINRFIIGMEQSYDHYITSMKNCLYQNSNIDDFKVEVNWD